MALYFFTFLILKTNDFNEQCCVSFSFLLLFVHSVPFTDFFFLYYFNINFCDISQSLWKKNLSEVRNIAALIMLSEWRIIYDFLCEDFTVLWIDHWSTINWFNNFEFSSVCIRDCQCNAKKIKVSTFFKKKYNFFKMFTVRKYYNWQFWPSKQRQKNQYFKLWYEQNKKMMKMIVRLF